MKKKVTKNIYRDRYDIPIDLMVRRADSDIRQSVNNSESLKQVEKMDYSSISPNLVFF